MPLQPPATTRLGTEFALFVRFLSVLVIEVSKEGGGGGGGGGGGDGGSGFWLSSVSNFTTL